MTKNSKGDFFIKKSPLLSKNILTSKIFIQILQQ